MKRTLALFAFALLAALGAAALGVPTATHAQTNTRPAITSFTTPLTSVDGNALAARTARVPVQWTTANRPVFANLFFEQIMPDGSAINVELPRLIPWVNSNDRGVAAPILPEGGGVTRITLRVRLVNLLSSEVLDEQQITLPVATGGGGNGGNTGERPTITRFASTSVAVRADQLAARTARVPVSWEVAGRPLGSTLIFEQILADNRVVNVELPRDNPWVNSRDSGVAAPIAPGSSAASVRLRVRLIDLLTGRVYDQRELSVGIDNRQMTPRIRYFTSTSASVSATELAQRTARVPVAWATDDRPDGSNLVFEQVLPNNSVINVELPRQNPLVPSEGVGVAAPILPTSGSTILLQVRLVMLGSGQVLDTKQITLPISGQVGTPPTQTPPPTLTPEPGVPTITGFGHNQPGLGETLELSWTALNATSVEVLAVFGAPVEAVGVKNLPANGETTLSIPLAQLPHGAQITLTYTALGANGTRDTETVTLPVVCPQLGLWGTYSNDCVDSAVSEVNYVAQPFERGTIVWRSDTRRIYVLVNGGTGRTFSDTWDSTSAISHSETAPAGLLLPQNGIGWLWTTNGDVRAALGWATAGEQPYTGKAQEAVNAVPGSTGTNVDYITLADGRTVRVYNEDYIAWNVVGG